MTPFTTVSAPGTLTGLPGLDAEFAERFESRRIGVNGVSLHAVCGGGDVDPILLLAGWPQTWYAWRQVMPLLAGGGRAVVALDARGQGASDKPRQGYDTRTLAADAVAVMDALGHDRFGVAGQDVGMWVGYAIAADHPDRVTRLAVAEGALPGVGYSPPVLSRELAAERLFHFAFNRLEEINEGLVAGRESLFFGHQFASKSHHADALDAQAVELYIDALTGDPDALRASFGPYRALEETILQNEQRQQKPLTLPVLAMGGDAFLGPSVAATMREVADDVRGLVFSDCGHFASEEAALAMGDALNGFFV